MSLSNDEASQPYRRVVVDGTAELVHVVGEDDVWRDQYRDIARRYISQDAAEDYVQRTIDQLRGASTASGPDARVRNWRMPVPGEPVEASGMTGATSRRPGHNRVLDARSPHSCVPP